MSSSNGSSAGGGITLAGALGLLFIGLKLGGAIHWSWWWVLVPFWGPAVLVLAVILVCAVIVGLASIFAGSRRTSARVRPAARSTWDD